MAHIHGVIFDVDGTLIDSNDAHAHAWVEAMAANGYQVAFEKVRPLIGMGGDKVLPERFTWIMIVRHWFNDEEGCDDRTGL